MLSFIRRSPHSPNVVKDPAPSLNHSPSTISSTSQSSITASIRQQVSSLASKLHFRRSAAFSKSGIEHISSVPWPQSPSRSPSPPSPDIRPPSGLGRRASTISVLETLVLDSPPPSPRYPRFPQHRCSPPPSPRYLRFPQHRFLKSPPASPTLAVSPDTTHSPPTNTSPYRGQARRARTQSSPALLSPVVETDIPPPAPEEAQAVAPPRIVVSPTSQTYEPYSPRRARRQARKNPPIPLSLVFAHVPRAQLPTLARVSRRFCAAAQLALYRTLELSATATATTKADACFASLASAPHLAALVTTLVLPAYPPAHGPSFHLALRLALRSMRALAALTLPTFDADLLAAVPPTLARLTLQADTLPFAFFDSFLSERPQIVHLALPKFVGVPPGPGEVPATTVPHLARLDASPGLATVLAPGRPVRRVTLRVASTLYDGLRPAALFDALGSQLKELVLVLAPDVDARTRGRLLGALAKTAEGLEALELQLEGKCDEVALQALYKQVGTLLPGVRALHTLRLRAVRTATAAESEEGPSRLAVWTRPREGLALRCMVFPSGARWELERGKWLRAN